MKATWIIPQMFTLANLCSGSMIIIELQGNKNPWVIGYFFVFCLIFDFLDGLSARFLNQISAFGKQLDSLADLVSFGVVPCLLAMELFEVSDIVKYSALLILVCAAIRLAKFNITESGANSFFSGLPSPAMAMFWVGYWWIGEYLGSPVYQTVAYILLSSVLMISPWPYLSLKFKRTERMLNIVRITMILSTFSVIFFTPFHAPVILLLLYTIFSFLFARIFHYEI